MPRALLTLCPIKVQIFLATYFVGRSRNYARVRYTSGVKIRKSGTGRTCWEQVIWHQARTQVGWFQGCKRPPKFQENVQMFFLKINNINFLLHINRKVYNLNSFHDITMCTHLFGVSSVINIVARHDCKRNTVKRFNPGHLRFEMRAPPNYFVGTSAVAADIVSRIVSTNTTSGI